MNSYTKLMFISNFGDTQDPILMFLLFDCYGVTCEFKISNLLKNITKSSAQKLVRYHGKVIHTSRMLIGVI